MLGIVTNNTSNNLCLFQFPGFDDALKFLARNNLLECQPCILSNYPSSHTKDQENNSLANDDSSCHQCEFHKITALSNPTLPDKVDKILREDIESGKRGFMNWLYSHQSVRLLSALTLPWVLPADIAYATGVKILDNVPLPSINLTTPDVKVFKTAISPLLSQPLVTWNGMSPIPIISLTPSNIIIDEVDGPSSSPDMELQIDLNSPLPTDTDMNYGYPNLENMEIVQEYKVRSRKHSMVFEDGAEDFEQFLNVTSNHDSLVADYYINVDSESSFGNTVYCNYSGIEIPVVIIN